MKRLLWIEDDEDIVETFRDTLEETFDLVWLNPLEARDQLEQISPVQFAAKRVEEIMNAQTEPFDYVLQDLRLDDRIGTEAKNYQVFDIVNSLREKYKFCWVLFSGAAPDEYQELRKKGYPIKLVSKGEQEYSEDLVTSIIDVCSDTT